jgi:hypothetical protein
MRKALLIVAMLLLATPVMAGVTITAVQEGAFIASDGNRVQTVRIDYSTDVNVRAFALDINIDCNGNVPNFQYIRGYKVGESNQAAVPPGTSGYGIFPSRFRDFVNPTNPGPNYVDPNYNPTTAWNEPGTTDHTWGMGYPRMIVELGTLYAGDPNRPVLSGTLFRFDVNAWGQVGTFNLRIVADTLRAGTTGAIGQDGNSVASSFVGTAITFGPVCTDILNEIGQDKAVAEAAWIGQGFSVSGTGTAYSDTIPANQVLTQDTGCFTPAGHTVNYTYCRGKFPAPASIQYPNYDPDCNIPIYWAKVTGATGYQLDRSIDSGSNWTNIADVNGFINYKGDAPGIARPTYRYRVRAKNADSNSLNLTGTYDCNAIISTCYRNGNTSDANWNNWRAVGRPDCWCKPLGNGLGPRGTGYQCDGDAAGNTEASPDNYRVYTSDLAMVTSNWKKKNSDLTMDANSPTGTTFKIVAACADMDHRTEASPDNYRIYTIDLAKVTGNWKKKNSNWSGTDKLPGDCPR